VHLDESDQGELPDQIAASFAARYLPPNIRYLGDGTATYRRIGAH
jgi:hypothetical protein